MDDPCLDSPALDRSQSLFYFVPQEKVILTDKLARLVLGAIGALGYTGNLVAFNGLKMPWTFVLSASLTKS